MSLYDLLVQLNTIDTFSFKDLNLMFQELAEELNCVDDFLEDEGEVTPIIAAISLLSFLSINRDSSTDVLTRIGAVVLLLSLQLLLLNHVLFGSFFIIIYAGAIMVLFLVCLLVFGDHKELQSDEAKTGFLNTQSILGTLLSGIFYFFGSAVEEELEELFEEQMEWGIEVEVEEYNIHELSHSLITHPQYVIIGGCVLIAAMIVIMKLSGENTTDHVQHKKC